MLVVLALLGVGIVVVLLGRASDPAARNELAGTTYLGVSTSDPRAVPEPRLMRLEFTADAMSVSGGCNETSGGYTADRGRLRLGDDARQTKMYCSGLSQDDWLNDLLSPTAKFELRDAGRTLIVRRGERSAVFGLRRLRGGPSPVEGRQWYADRYEQPDRSASLIDTAVARPTLRIAAGEATIFTGCSRGTASVSFGERTLTFGAFRPTRKTRCERDAARVDRSMRRALGGTVRVEYWTAHRLTLAGRDGTRLALTDHLP